MLREDEYLHVLFAEQLLRRENQVISKLVSVVSREGRTGTEARTGTESPEKSAGRANNDARLRESQKLEGSVREPGGSLRGSALLGPGGRPSGLHSSAVLVPAERVRVTLDRANLERLKSSSEGPLRLVLEKKVGLGRYYAVEEVDCAQIRELPEPLELLGPQDEYRLRLCGAEREKIFEERLVRYADVLRGFYDPVAGFLGQSLLCAENEVIRVERAA